MDEQRCLPSSNREAFPKRTGLSLVWIIPIVAAAAGLWVAATRILSEGPDITITFSSAEGLEAGKTKIRYKGVDVGTVRTIRPSEDHMRVIAEARMAPMTEDFLVEDTQFWVVRPRISGASITGLSTLLSGAYIGMASGSTRKSRRDFVALAIPPAVKRRGAGQIFRAQGFEPGFARHWHAAFLPSSAGRWDPSRFYSMNSRSTPMVQR